MRLGLSVAIMIFMFALTACEGITENESVRAFTGSPSTETSRSNLAPFGQPVVQGDIGDIEVTVLDVARIDVGDIGSTFSTDSLMYWSIPLDVHTKEWIILSLKLRNPGSFDSRADYSILDFELVDSKGVVYTQNYLLETQSPFPALSGELFGGGEVIGDMVFDVEQDEKSFLLVYSSYVETLLSYSEKQSYFSLQMP